MNIRRQVGGACVIAGTMLALTSTTAFASGLELAWNQCFGQTGSTYMRTSACAVNTGSQTVIASFRPPPGITALEGVQVIIDYQITGGVLPCWWNFASGQLRESQLTVLAVSPTDGGGTPLLRCDNHYFLDHGAVGGGDMIVTATDRGQLRGIAAVTAGTGLPVPADAQQYGIGFRIANGNTVPAASCAGCYQSACLIVSSTRLTSPGLPDVVLQGPHPGSEHFVMWQGQPFQCVPTPVAPSTWGSIKSIYR